jgi:hypothetical protein
MILKTKKERSIAIMKYVGFIILLLGALFSFFAKKLIIKYKNIDEPTGKDIAVTKIVGFFIACVGALIVFYF